ncbi:MAG: pyridoxamine 5'-phosphate oxidase family protein [Parafilimonas sp.]
MGDVKNIANKEAVEKIKTLAEKAQTCLFCTKIETGKAFSTRPMSAQKVDDNGNIWFLSDKDSLKNMEIKDDDNVQLLFSGSSHSDFLSVYGKASILFDKEKIKELYEPIVKAWFKEGEDDPNISVIKIEPSEGYYWDTKHGKLISLAKIVASMVSGKTMDDGIQGKIKL